MRLALLGIDDDSLDLARWAASSGQHELVAAYEADLLAPELRDIAPAIRLSDNWEELLLGSAADAVIVGRGGHQTSAERGVDPREQRADQLRKLVQAAVPMIVVCPACEAIVGFEIEMIRRDTKAIIVPYIPGSLYSAFLLPLAFANDETQIGTLAQISLEREQADRSRQAVLVQLARDATLLRQLIGAIQAVCASGPPIEVGRDPLGPKPKVPHSLANLSVSFTGESGLSARWSMAPALEQDLGRLILIGDRGKAVMTMASGSWFCRVGNSPPTTGSSDSIEAEQVLERLTGAMTTDFYDDYWLAACRDQEAAEAVDRSLARGRTIELFNEEHTEEASFKGIMAMGGCLLLVGAMCVLLFATMVEGLQLPMRGWPIWRLWPVYLLVPIAVFLLLQLFSLAAKRSDTPVNRLASHGSSGT